jgi:glycosyltransferase involved in cell wall biosynthesis
LFVGRLEKQKNLNNLIKAASLLDKKDKISILFIGHGSLKKELIEFAENKSVKLKIIDQVAHDKLADYYHWADIFCLLSHLEGQAKVLLEAMSCGLPCLVSDKSWSDEFKDKNEVLKTRIDSKSIAESLKALFKDKDLRKKLSINSRKRIKKDFNINSLLKKETKILQLLITSN